jgi:uncharacterized protein YlzI (FlbEa/FlbD family)
VDGTYILINKYHITTVSQSVHNPESLTIRFNNGSVQDVSNEYEEVKASYWRKIRCM